MTATWRATWKITSTRSTRCRRRWPACRRLLSRVDDGRRPIDDSMAEVAPRVRPPDGRLLVGWMLAGTAGTVLATLLARAIGAAGWDPGWSGWLLLSTNLILYVVQWAILRAYL